MRTIAAWFSARPALRFVIWIGVLSLLADVTDEGGRSIAGSYLAVLGATGTMVGLIAGMGELAGYGSRLLSGVLSDRLQRLWLFMWIGYFVNLVAIPLLALAGRWEIAAALLILERIGKGIRTPVRDVMLSYASGVVGRGWAFGLHEALDQIGAVLGPVIVAAMLLRTSSYPSAFGILAIPAGMALLVLLRAHLAYSHPQRMEPIGPRKPSQAFSRAFWLYLAGVALLAAGYVDFALIAFHLERGARVARPWIPIAYALAMGVDALAALVLGWAYERRGVRVLRDAIMLSAMAAPLIFLGDPFLVIAGVVLWGIGTGAQESILRAIIAAQIPQSRRGTAYGLFYLVYGTAWMLGSVLLGWLYDRSVPVMAGVSAGLQIGAIGVLALEQTVEDFNLR
jgi:MFS family permease